MIWYLPSGEGDCALILFVTKESSKAVSDEKYVTQHHTCGAHMRNVPWIKPFVDPVECLICLTNEQVRCNECFNGKNRYTGVCWFVSTDSVGHATLMNQFRTLPMPKLFAALAIFLWLAFVVIFDDCFKNWNVVSWHGNAYTRHVVLDVHNQLCFL